MTMRTYTLTLTGRIAVDDATLQASMLGMEFQPAPGVEPLSEAEWAVVQQQVLGIAGELSPADRMRVYLTAGPLDAVRTRLAGLVERTLPGASVEVVLTAVQVEPDGTSS